MLAFISIFLLCKLAKFDFNFSTNHLGVVLTISLIPTGAASGSANHKASKGKRRAEPSSAPQKKVEEEEEEDKVSPPIL